jgi:predicted flavoprotein YhiN
LKPSIAIIGGGASALFLAATIDTNQYSVTIYEKNKALGRKFLVAGDGGFNLTHGSPIEEMKKQYHPQGFLDNCLDAFTNTDLRQWLKQIGIATFEGSSHRIYPNKGIKPIQVLQNIIQLLQKKRRSDSLQSKLESMGRKWQFDF